MFFCGVKFRINTLFNLLFFIFLTLYEPFIRHGMPWLSYRRTDMSKHTLETRMHAFLIFCKFKYFGLNITCFNWALVIRITYEYQHCEWKSNLRCHCILIIIRKLCMILGFNNENVSRLLLFNLLVRSYN